MSWLVDPTQRVLEQALDGLSARNAVIASNLANIDTPGYVPQSVDFESALRAEIGNAGLDSTVAGGGSADAGAESAGSAGSAGRAGSPPSATAVTAGMLNPPSSGPSAAVALLRTDPRHFAGEIAPSGTSGAETTPFAGTLRNDGNQVDVESEMTALVQTQLRFSAVSRLATGKLDLLNDVLGGR